MRADTPSVPTTVADGSIAQSIADRILVRAREAAALLSISERSLWTLTTRGEIPCVRISEHCVRYRPIDLAAWAEKRASTSRDPIPLIAEREAT